MKDNPKPIFPLKHEFYASLDNFIHQAGMLADAVDTCLSTGAISPRIADMIKERLDAFNKARGS